jgi:nucleoside-diphosphate-sugar epimerase
LNIFTRRETGDIKEFSKSGARIFKGTFDDTHHLKDACADVDVIFHVAGAVAALNKKDYYRSNTASTAAILEVAQKNQRIVLVSSLAAAGPCLNGVAITEEMEPCPITHYGQSKLDAEKLLLDWGKQNNANFMILRPAVVFGPYEKNILQFFKMVKRGWIIIMGTGEKQVSMVYIDDLIDALMVCATSSQKGETVFVANDRPLSWNEFSTEIKNAVKPKHLLSIKVPEWFAYPIACIADGFAQITRKPTIVSMQKIIEMKQPAWICSNEKLRQLGWSPKFSISESIGESAKWYQEKGWI